MRKPTPGEYLCGGDEGDEALVRGHVTAEDAAEELAEWDFEATGAPVHTWARRGFGTDQDGVRHGGYLYTGRRYAGQRGAFRVTAFDVRKIND